MTIHPGPRKVPPDPIGKAAGSCGFLRISLRQSLTCTARILPSAFFSAADFSQEHIDLITGNVETLLDGDIGHAAAPHLSQDLFFAGRGKVVEVFFFLRRTDPAEDGPDLFPGGRTPGRTFHVKSGRRTEEAGSPGLCICQREKSCPGCQTGQARKDPCTGPGIGEWIPGKARPDRISADKTETVCGIRDVLFPEAGPEERSFFPVPSLDAAVRAVRAVKEQMDVVLHQAVAIKAEIFLLYGLVQKAEKGKAVFIVLKKERIVRDLQQDMNRKVLSAGDHRVGQKMFLSEEKEEMDRK